MEYLNSQSKMVVAFLSGRGWVHERLGEQDSHSLVSC